MVPFQILLFFEVFFFSFQGLDCFLQFRECDDRFLTGEKKTRRGKWNILSFFDAPNVITRRKVGDFVIHCSSLDKAINGDGMAFLSTTFD